MFDKILLESSTTELLEIQPQHTTRVWKTFVLGQASLKHAFQQHQVQSYKKMP